ncbi:unnamed protein product [Trifolium pratense]|uniref:Uncharacterized protein n=1 Tax=Trifolium pratense TaxID=57577 RepID=A0ACB0JJ49_TRIPR|nr:unnamed protein product [Trifolium pratense]
MALISTEQLHLYHKMDRKIFSLLVIQLARNPSQSLLVMALWLWLESLGYPSLISKLVGISLNTINDVANEAESCLMCLELENFPIPKNGGLLLTTTILDMAISLKFFKLRRFSIIYGVKYVLNETCARIFDDILLHVLGKTYVSRLLPPYPYCRPMINIPGFPHPLFGKFPPIKFEEFNCDSFGRMMWTNNRLFDDVENEDKTMFLTFSKGFPVTGEEVRHFFTINYGVHCIKSIRMGKRNSNGQVLDATMVVNNLETLDIILNGRRLAKFDFNRKHIWARKYERRE